MRESGIRTKGKKLNLKFCLRGIHPESVYKDLRRGIEHGLACQTDAVACHLAVQHAAAF